MAVSGYVDSLLGGIEADLKRVLTEAFRYVLPNGRFGPVSHQAKSESFQAYMLLSTTTASSNTEFSILHGMGRAPYTAVQVLDLGTSGGQWVPLTVSRPADAQRVYLRSPSTAAPFSILAE